MPDALLLPLLLLVVSRCITQLKKQKKQLFGNPTIADGNCIRTNLTTLYDDHHCQRPHAAVVYDPPSLQGLGTADDVDFRVQKIADAPNSTR